MFTESVGKNTWKKKICSFRSRSHMYTCTWNNINLDKFMALTEHFILGFVSLLSLVVGWQTARLRHCATKQKVKVMFLLNRFVNLQITQFFGDSVAFILQFALENLFIFPQIIDYMLYPLRFLWYVGTHSDIRDLFNSLFCSFHETWQICIRWWAWRCNWCDVLFFVIVLRSVVIFRTHEEKSCFQHQIICCSIESVCLFCFVLFCASYCWSKIFKASSDTTYFNSSGSCPGKGGEKHEIYAVSFGGYLFCDLFWQGWGAYPLGHPWIRYCLIITKTKTKFNVWFRLPETLPQSVPVNQNHVKDRSMTPPRIHNGAPSEDRTHDPWFTRPHWAPTPCVLPPNGHASSDVMVTPIALWQHDILFTSSFVVV